jgi:hypothetical protein
VASDVHCLHYSQVMFHHEPCRKYKSIIYNLHLVYLTLSNPIFLPTAYSQALIFLQVQPCKYNAQSPVHINTHGLPRNRKSTTCAIRWLKSVLHEEKCRTGSDSRAGGPQTQQKRVGRLPTSERNRKIIMSDEVRRRIGKG